MLLICIFILQLTQKQDGGYLNSQNKWNVGSDAFIIAQNINHREGVLFKAILYILYINNTKWIQTKMTVKYSL